MSSSDGNLMKHSLNSCLTLLLITTVNAAPLPTESPNHPMEFHQMRNGKSLTDYYDYLPQDEFEADIGNDYLSIEDTENEVLSRGSLSKRHNSPIYYIRLPPAPYMFVPGLGYVSQPPSVSPLGPTTNSFINLPISFVSNGKPSAIYQWHAGYQPGLPSQPTAASIALKPKPKPKPNSTPDSTVHRLPGKYPFNGKPSDILVLRDSYNSLYADALQNFYP